MPSVFLGDFPEPDLVEGAPHPRSTLSVFGHEKAEQDFLDAFNSHRLHHAWLITGPRGIGKATFGWKLARFLLATPLIDGGMFAPPPTKNLDVSETNPIVIRTRVLSEPRVYLLRRGLNEKDTLPATQLLVKEVRELKKYFNLSSADGGRRVAIIDCIDEMNSSAANAFLKLLEEPPAGVTFLVISHRPSGLLPTIRSRCRELRLAPIAAEPLFDALTQAGGDVAPEDRTALAELAGGSVGEAFRMTNLDGLKTYESMIRLFTTLPRLDRPRALSLAEQGAGKGAEQQFELIVTLLDLFLARLARAGTLGQLPPEAAKGEADLIARLSPTPAHAREWADVAQHLGLRARRGKAVNLDPAALLMDMLLHINETAAGLA